MPYQKFFENRRLVMKEREEHYFNFIYNGDEKLGMGKGYYYFFQSLDKEPEDLFGAFYPTKETEHVDFVSVGILNQMKHSTDLGWKYNPYYHVDLEEQFKRRED